ncbi:TPM domain-containing protein [Pseudonocardia nigra]|uniref:TPM domain-containing protein n=1 Tax=Pseudonocardia nigra TaxID=1921578 RepID=UPI001C5E30BC|nr:TPM domain-containing protein [Pseudonocardia nigra]
MRRFSAIAAVLAVLLLGGAATAPAEPPFRLADGVTDRAGVLDPAGTAAVADAVGELRADEGIDLFVVYVDSFSGADGPTWAAEAARLSQLGREDVLFAVAVGDRAYGVHVDPEVSLSQSAIDDALTAAEDRLAADDWAGAAVALADELGGGSGGSGGAVAWTLVALAGAVVVIGGFFLLSRRRRSRTAPPPAAAPAPGDEFGEVATADLAYRVSSALIEVDDAVRTSEEELAAARAHFGAEAVAGFAEALEKSKADMLAAFATRQRLDDDEPEDEAAQRALYAEIIRSCRAADERLDAQAEAFDRLRGLEVRAEEFVGGLGTRLDAVTARVPAAESAWARLVARYAAAALEPVADHLDRARQLLADARTEVAEAQAELTRGARAASVVSGRVAEDALTQAEVLLDGVPRREGELADAATRIPAARAEVEQDLAEAGASPKRPPRWWPGPRPHCGPPTRPRTPRCRTRSPRCTCSTRPAARSTRRWPRRARPRTAPAGRPPRSTTPCSRPARRWPRPPTSSAPAAAPSAAGPARGSPRPSGTCSEPVPGATPWRRSGRPSTRTHSHRRRCGWPGRT